MLKAGADQDPVVTPEEDIKTEVKAKIKEVEENINEVKANIKEVEANIKKAKAKYSEEDLSQNPLYTANVNSLASLRSLLATYETRRKRLETQAGGAVVEGAWREAITELTKKVHAVAIGQHEAIAELTKKVDAVAIGQHIMLQKLPLINEVLINPSEYQKSRHNETFLDLMDVVGFGRVPIASQVSPFSGELPLRSDELDFSFRWEGQLESASYEPLLQHLLDRGIHAVRVSEQEGLSGGLLYREQLWALKKNISLRYEDLRKIGQEPIRKYVLQGSTDFVIKWDMADPLGKSGNRYFIEIKRVQDFAEENSLREAVLQLIGGNASNSFHSPPVLLTNLATMHYVLYISLVGDPAVHLKFKLNVVKMPSFGAALAFVEERTADMNSVTMHFCRKPTPASSPPKVKNASEPEDDEDITERFGNASLEEVVTDDDGNPV